MRLTAFRPRQRKGEKQLFHLRLALIGMLGIAPRCSTCLRIALSRDPCQLQVWQGGSGVKVLQQLRDRHLAA